MERTNPADNVEIMRLPVLPSFRRLVLEGPFVCNAGLDIADWRILTKRKIVTEGLDASMPGLIR